MRPLLEIHALNKRFGGLHVTRSVNLTLKAGSIHCLIGPNGAGKSTLFRLILGEHLCDGGRILFLGEDVTRLQPFERVRRGISVKFQVPGIFKDLSVQQNLQIAVQRRHAPDVRSREVDRLLDYLQLRSEARQRAGALSHGQKQWLEIGMALSLEPKLLLLDEPTAGMSPDETFATGDMIKRLNADGMGVLAVEHDMAFVRQVAQDVTVLHLGGVFAQGSVDDIVADERVAAIYLGQAHA